MNLSTKFYGMHLYHVLGLVLAAGGHLVLANEFPGLTSPSNVVFVRRAWAPPAYETHVEIRVSKAQNQAGFVLTLYGVPLEVAGNRSWGLLRAPDDLELM